MRKWFTSDQHFGHQKIIRYCQRPFRTLDEMNSEMIRRWNERVKPDDLVFQLGDFCFKGGSEGGRLPATVYSDQLNGNKIFLKGNHDNNNSNKTNIESITINMGGSKILLIHRPFDTFRLGDHINYYDMVFCGHVHNNWIVKFPGEYKYNFKENEIPLINLSVDVWNFMPVSFDEIYRKFQKIKKEGRKKEPAETK
ncbi:MAG: metallophosphoesterase family protein [Candidatus Hodarchaeales archaeon]